MLKTKPLNQLLSQSISPNVSSALLFTPSGSLLATGSSPTAPDAKKARTNAALAANIWAAYDRVTSSGAAESSLSTSVDFSAEDGLKSLTLEFSEYNMHVQLVAPRVLLCLIGPRALPVSRHTSSRSSAHSHHDGITPPGSVPRSAGTSTGGGGAGSVREKGQGGALGLLKTQAAGLAAYLQKELMGYELPDGL